MCALVGKTNQTRMIRNEAEHSREHRAQDASKSREPRFHGSAMQLAATAHAIPTSGRAKDAADDLEHRPAALGMQGVHVRSASANLAP